VATGSDTATAFSMAVQFVSTDTLNANQCTTYNADGTPMANMPEARLARTHISVDDKTARNVQLTVFEKLSGIRSPNSVATENGAPGFDACTSTIKFYFGTPAEIRLQVLGY